MTGPSRTFRFDACLGRGGFGEVYRARMARDGGFGVDVAVKLLRADVDPRAQAVERLRDEARILGLLRHRAVPRVVDLVVLEGRVAMVSEYIHGEDLGHLLEGAPPMPRRPLLECLAEVADALHAAAHATVPGRDAPAGIVHRDLKPGNIRVGTDGATYLLDFGIAWTDTLTRAASTQPSALVGSPAYMAPERFAGRTPGPKDDVYALGAVLMEGLTGRRLFADVDFRGLAALAFHQRNFDEAVTERLATLLPDDLTPTLPDLLRDLLAHDPDARPVAHEAAERLRTAASHSPGPTLARWARARDWPAAAAREGPWVGRTVTEGSGPLLVEPSEAQVAAVRAWQASDRDTAPTTPPPAPPTTPTTFADLPAPTPDRRTVVRVTVAAALVGALAIAWNGLVGREDAAPAPPPTELVRTSAPVAEAPAPVEAAAEAVPVSADPEPVSSAPTEPPGDDADAPAPAAEAPRARPRRPPPSPPDDAAPAEAVAEPAPSADPAPAPPRAPRARVAVELGGYDAISARDRDSGASHPLPGPLPPGTYEVVGLRDGLPHRGLLDLTVSGGDRVGLQCSQVLRKCGLKP